MHFFAPRTRWIHFFLLLICSALIRASIGHGAYVPQSATRLIADIDTRESAEPDRIPLILIHGFTGTDGATFEAITGASDSEKEYFKEFLEYFYTTETLNDTYKLYRFHYLSNEVDVSTIGADLRIWIDEAITSTSDQMVDTELVLMGHSMGGLVSRAYMEEQEHLMGSFADRKGGERVRKLITLGTPHHGSQAANDTARDAGEGWNDMLEIVDLIFWQGIGLEDPNRSDLRWDNYNNMQGLSPGYEGEKNTWLSALNQNSVYSEKIIAYAGGVEGLVSGQISDRYSLKLLWEQLRNSTPTQFNGLYSVCTSSGILPGKNNWIYPFKGPYDSDRPFTFRMKLCFCGVLLEKMYDKNNDGLVPTDSADYIDGGVGKTRWFEGFDHWDLKSDRIGQPAELMLRLQEDLEIPKPDLNDVITVLKTLAGISVSTDNLMDLDKNENQRLDMADALMLLQILSGIR